MVGFIRLFLLLCGFGVFWEFEDSGYCLEGSCLLLFFVGGCWGFFGY